MRPARASEPASRLLSISHLTVLDATPPELVTAAADAGFDAVGIRVWPAAGEAAFPMLGELVGALPAQASLAVESPVADLANRTIGERSRLAHAALVRMRKANPYGGRAGMR